MLYGDTDFSSMWDTTAASFNPGAGTADAFTLVTDVLTSDTD